MKVLKTLLQYIIVLGITALLIGFSLNTIQVGEGENKWDYLKNTWNAADKGWLVMMALLFMISNIFRAERWKMLLKPTDNHTTLSATFLSVLVGYLVNLVILRGGEVSRCYNLYKLDRTPVNVSFGSVVAERIIDLIFLMLLIGLAFIVEFEKLFAFIHTLPIEFKSVSEKILFAVIALLGLGIVVFLVYQLIKRNQKIHDFVLKTLEGFRHGFAAVFRLENKGLFIFYSVTIWVLYFFMSYCVILAFDETSSLGWRAVLSLFAIGSIAMAAPLPGGAGSYHALVPAGLVFLYAIPLSQATAFVFVFHGWQTLIMILGGAVSLVITAILVRRKASQL